MWCCSRAMGMIARDAQNLPQFAVGLLATTAASLLDRMVGSAFHCPASRTMQVVVLCT